MKRYSAGMASEPKNSSGLGQAGLLGSLENSTPLGFVGRVVWKVPAVSKKEFSINI